MIANKKLKSLYTQLAKGKSLRPSDLRQLMQTLILIQDEIEVSIPVPAVGGVQEQYTHLTFGQLDGINAAPVVSITGVPGQVIIPVASYTIYNFVTPAFANFQLRLEYATGGVSTSQMHNANFLNQVTTQRHARMLTLNISLQANEPEGVDIVIGATGDPGATGRGNVDTWIQYFLINPVIL